MDFGVALRLLQSGERITRAGWNGKGMWLYYVPENSYAAQTAAAKSQFGDKVPYRAYIAMVTAQCDVVPWVASQSDMLAEDWEVCEPGKSAADNLRSQILSMAATLHARNIRANRLYIGERNVPGLRELMQRAPTFKVVEATKRASIYGLAIYDVDDPYHLSVEGAPNV